MQSDTDSGISRNEHVPSHVGKDFPCGGLELLDACLRLAELLTLRLYPAGVSGFSVDRSQGKVSGALRSRAECFGG